MADPQQDDLFLEETVDGITEAGPSARQMGISESALAGPVKQESKPKVDKTRLTERQLKELSLGMKHSQDQALQRSIQQRFIQQAEAERRRLEVLEAMRGNPELHSPGLENALTGTVKEAGRWAKKTTNMIRPDKVLLNIARAGNPIGKSPEYIAGEVVGATLSLTDSLPPWAYTAIPPVLAAEQIINGLKNVWEVRKLVRQAGTHDELVASLSERIRTREENYSGGSRRVREAINGGIYGVLAGATIPSVAETAVGASQTATTVAELTAEYGVEAAKLTGYLMLEYGDEMVKMFPDIVWEHGPNIVREYGDEAAMKITEEAVQASPDVLLKAIAFGRNRKPGLKGEI